MVSLAVHGVSSFVFGVLHRSLHDKVEAGHGVCPVIGFPAAVKLVGVVERVLQQAATTEFLLNDSTGRVLIHQYHTRDALMVPGLRAGEYVAVVGRLRLHPAPHLQAACVRRVAGADEVSYHVAESVRMQLRSAPPDYVHPVGLDLPLLPSVPAAQLTAGDPVRARGVERCASRSRSRSPSRAASQMPGPTTLWGDTEAAGSIARSRPRSRKASSDKCTTTQLDDSASDSRTCSPTQVFCL